VISALLLAAGASRRFGGAPKVIQQLDGKPIVRWSAEALVSASVDEVIVVVPPNDAEIRRALVGLDVRFTMNRRPEEGMGSSIAAGVHALSAHTEAVLVALADEPTLPRDAVVKVIARYRADSSRGVHIVAPTYHGTRGHPTLFDRAVFDELKTLGHGSDRGARDIIDLDPSRVTFLELDVAPPGDVDTPDDLARMQARAHYIPPQSLHRS
jgi:CTP:molybdopterin cytidylyltransferase MocA